MPKITLTPEDAAAIGRVIEEGADRIAEGPQRDTAYLVGHKLLSSQGVVVIETDQPASSLLGGRES